MLIPIYYTISLWYMHYKYRNIAQVLKIIQQKSKHEFLNHAIWSKLDACDNFGTYLFIQNSYVNYSVLFAYHIRGYFYIISKVNESHAHTDVFDSPVYMRLGGIKETRISCFTSLCNFIQNVARFSQTQTTSSKTVYISRKNASLIRKYRIIIKST